MSAHRGPSSALVATIVGTGILLNLYVVPAVPAPGCVADVVPSNSPGHRFCSQVVVRARPARICSQPNETLLGAPVVSHFMGYTFGVRLFSVCGPLGNLGLNASITQPNSRTFDLEANALLPWWNWTSPDHQSGLQWQVNDSLAWLVAG